MKYSPIKHTPALLLALFATSTGAYAGITGTNPTAAADYQQYQQVGATLVPNNAVSLASVLVGDATNPGGNVELFKSSETLSNAAYATYNQTTSLEGTLGSGSITLSSLNASDWSANVGGGQTLLQKWTLDLFTTYLPAVNTAANRAGFDGLFTANGGLQRFSDPNISYVTTQNGTINIGLAGLLNASSLLSGILPPALLPLLPASVQLSELVKVSYNGATSYLYGFNATASGLATTDGTNSFNGNYNLTLSDSINTSSQLIRLNVQNTQQVPEPSIVFLLGLGLIGLTLARKKQA